MVKQELSEYEQQRQANIAERDALLKKLALDAPVVNLTKKLSHQPSTTKPNRKKPLPKRIKEEVTPRRTSSRLAGIEADSAKAKRKAEQEYEVAKEVERVKRQRVSGDLELKDVIVSGKQWGNGGFLVDVVNRSAQPYVKTFSDTEVKATSDKELKALREKMNGLELYEGFEPNSMRTVSILNTVAN